MRRRTPCLQGECAEELSEPARAARGERPAERMHDVSARSRGENSIALTQTRAPLANLQTIDHNGAIMGDKTKLVSKQTALPGREQPMAVPAEHFVSKTRMTPPFPAGLDQATFGMGCFWGAERKFWTIPGVYSTAAG